MFILHPWYYVQDNPTQRSHIKTVSKNIMLMLPAFDNRFDGDDVLVRVRGQVRIYLFGEDVDYADDIFTTG